MQGPLFDTDYRSQFSGHETFPLRYGWLKKAYDCVADTELEDGNRSACWGDDAIAQFGVGKNMVSSIRYWAKAVNIIREPNANTVETTDLGRMIFGSAGLDQWMEFPVTLWLLHWQLASNPQRTTWFWAFSHYPAIFFDRDSLVSKLNRLVIERGWPRVALSTLNHDVACFIRTYVARQPLGKAVHDDALESPLTELGLIKAIGRYDSFRFVRGPKPTLGAGVFVYSLIDFWARHHPNTHTLSFEAVTYAPGSPGRVFQLDENDIANRLAKLDEVTGDALRWTDTAGLKQVIRNIEISNETATIWLSRDYDSFGSREAA